MRKLHHEMSLEQQNKFLMTTELHQAISLFQMSAIELNDFILRKIAENPFLDEDNRQSQSVQEETSLSNTTISLDQFMDHTESKRNIEKHFLIQTNLQEHLEHQLNLEVEDSLNISIGYFLIRNIDSNGYLYTDLKEVRDRFHVPIRQINRVLKVIQSFDPPGVGARNLKECLLLQLKNSDKEYWISQKVIKNHLDHLAERKMNKIAEELKISTKKVQEVYDLIKKLNPRPGQAYGSVKNPFIWPDVMVIKDHGSYTIIVNDLDYSFLKINKDYIDFYRDSHSLINKDVKEYLEESLQVAIGLIKGIELRKVNLAKVVQCIVNYQDDFFDKGIEFLKPLTMSRLADCAKIHESTVSRIVANKYVQTPRGLFSLKYFFTTGIDSQKANKVSSKSVKHYIQEIVKSEDRTMPLSDQDIVGILANKGISISRRTVNKYRQSLGIPSNTQRRRY
jgi:RNA polymerase sigma-54 factor